MTAAYVFAYDSFLLPQLYESFCRPGFPTFVVEIVHVFGAEIFSQPFGHCEITDTGYSLWLLEIIRITQILARKNILHEVVPAMIYVHTFSINGCIRRFPEF